MYTFETHLAADRRKELQRKADETHLWRQARKHRQHRHRT
jgi:hypothetical protein